MKSGNLNFLEPSGPLQACNGTALPLPLHALDGSMLRQINGHIQATKIHEIKITIANNFSKVTLQK